MERGLFLKAVLVMAFVSAIVIAPLVQPMAQSKEPVVLKSWSLSWIEAVQIWRILGEDFKKLGIEVKMRTGGIGEWVGDVIRKENPYHLVTMTWTGSPERIEPSYFMIEFFHSNRAKIGGRNYGNYINPEFDKLMDAQLRETDYETRKQMFWKAQEILYNDDAFFSIYYKDMVQVYNSDRIEGVIPTMGSGIGWPYNPWTYFKARTKGKIKEPRVVNRKDLMSTNPFTANEGQTMGWMRLLYDTYVKRDRDNKLIPWAAESWDMVDDTTFDIVIRDGMKWSDGKPVTVEDAKFTFEFIKKWKFPMYAAATRSIESVEVKDARTLRFHLKQPYAPFVANILLVTIIAPKHIWEKIPESVGVKNPMDWPNPKPVGSGPYIFAEWKKKEYFHFKANKEHFIGPNFEGFYYLFVPTVEGMMAMLEKEQAEIYGFALDSVQAAKLDALPHLTKVRVNSHSVSEIRPNFKMKPMDDPKFRRALQYIIDRKKLLNVIYQGEGVVGRTTPLAPTLAPWHNPNVTFFEYDLNKARRILKEAGYTWDDKGRLYYPE